MSTVQHYWRYYIIHAGQLLIAICIAIFAITVGKWPWPAAILAGSCIWCLSVLALERRFRERNPFGIYIYSNLTKTPVIHISVVVGLLILVAMLGTRSLLKASSEHGNLGPSEAPTLVTTIVSLTGAIGVLVGAVCLGISRIVRASGASDRDRGEGERHRNDGQAALMLARAEQMRAEADLIRARKGLPALPSDESLPGQANQEPPTPPSLP